MCHLSKKDQYVCQINQGVAEAVTSVLGGAQFPSCPFYHPRSSRCRLGHTREADVCAGNVPDSNGISGDFKRQKRSHQTEPVPAGAGRDCLWGRRHEAHGRFLPAQAPGREGVATSRTSFWWLGETEQP